MPDQFHWTESISLQVLEPLLSPPHPLGRENQTCPIRTFLRCPERRTSETWRSSSTRSMRLSSCPFLVSPHHSTSQPSRYAEVRQLCRFLALYWGMCLTFHAFPRLEHQYVCRRRLHLPANQLLRPRQLFGTTGRKTSPPTQMPHLSLHSHTIVNEVSKFPFEGARVVRFNVMWDLVSPCFFVFLFWI